MKIKQLFVGLSAVALVSCGGEKTQTPEEVAMKFAEATKKMVEENDASDFKDVASAEMYDLMSFMQEMTKDEEAMKKPVELFTEVSCETKENTAKCNCKTAEGGEGAEELYLEKEEGKWVVAGMKGKKITAEEVKQTKDMFKAMKEMADQMKNGGNEMLDSLDAGAGDDLESEVKEGMEVMEEETME